MDIRSQLAQPYVGPNRVNEGVRAKRFATPLYVEPHLLASLGDFYKEDFEQLHEA